MKILKVLAVGVAVVGVGVASTLTVNAAEWKARTVDQIKADVAKTNGKEYIIVWGDTLGRISQAINTTVDALAQLNSIANVDLIFAGNKLIFDGDVMTVQNDQGETLAQTVIQPEQKVDPNKNVGEAVDTTDKTTESSSTTNEGSNNSGTTTSSTTGDNTSNSSTNTTDSTSNSGNTGGSTGNTGGSNTGDSSNTGNSSSNTGESNTGGSSSNTGDTSTGGSNGGTGETTEPSTPEEPEEPTIVSGYIGNSGKVFNTKEEANAYGYEKLNSGEIKRFVVIGIFYSDGSEKASLDFYY